MTAQRRQSLTQAIAAVRDGRIELRCGLDGCPEGGWPETLQAIRALEEELPHRSMRTYSVHDLIAKVYMVDHAGRYQVR